MNNEFDTTQLDAYLACLKTQRKLSPHTVSNYGRDLRELVGLATAAGVATSFPAIDHFQIRRFASQLHSRGLGPRSIARKLSAWRGFFDWLSETVALKSNPVEGIKAPKRGKPLPKALSVDDAVRLVADTGPVAIGKDGATTACNRAMFELLYSSGLRVSELTNLDIRYSKTGSETSLGWIDEDASEVTVTGKGEKMRKVPIGKAALDAITAWLPFRDQLANPYSTALFLTGRGTRMSPRLIQMRLKAHAQALGIPTDVHPHVLRHSFASHVLQSSGDLRAVQEMLGHASITSTQIYTSLDFQRLAQVYDAAHPRARKRS
jgi:integrase/recombinase XerC